MFKSLKIKLLSFLVRNTKRGFLRAEAIAALRPLLNERSLRRLSERDLFCHNCRITCYKQAYDSNPICIYCGQPMLTHKWKTKVESGFYYKLRRTFREDIIKNSKNKRQFLLVLALFALVFVGLQVCMIVYALLAQRPS